MLSFDFYVEISNILEEMYAFGLTPFQCQFFLLTDAFKDTNTPSAVTDFIFKKQNMSEEEVKFF